MARFYFHTTGAQTAAFPTAAQLNTSSTTMAANYAASCFSATDMVTLIGINVLTAPGAADALSFVNSAGTAVTPSYTIPTSIATFNRPTFPEGGLPMPQGGFGITTTAASSVYQFIFDVTKSVFVANS